MGGMGLRAAAVCLLLAWGVQAQAQVFHRRAKVVAPHASTLTFMKKDGSCVKGAIARIEPKAITIRPAQPPPVAIKRVDLLQAREGDSVFFSARSSWADVEAVELRPHETLVVKTRKGETIKGNPLQVSPDGLVYKRFLWMTKRTAKAQIVSVDYLRVKPASDAIDTFAQEGPAMLFFYPDFYDRLKGLEGRVPVRLYDALLPEDDAVLKCTGR